MVDAIHVAKNQKEHEKIKKEIKEDPRKLSDLYVDRYGAQPVHIAFLIPESKFKLEVLESNKLTTAEFFNNGSIMCLLKSIPIKDLFGKTAIKYRKVKIESDKLLKKYKISELPTLLFFKKGKLLEKVIGFYDTKQKEQLIEKIKKIIYKRYVL
ncbi:thioredoxin family protein [Patescibacteria group bacterium]|nr:thioredoxin family protein [Patescibacteria group bacterium]